VITASSGHLIDIAITHSMSQLSSPLVLCNVVLRRSVRFLLPYTSWQRFLSREGLSALRPTPSDPGGPMFSVRVVSLSWRSPTKASGTRVSSLHVLAVRDVAQGPWRGHACMWLGRNKWHFLSCVSTRLSAYHAPSGPYTNPLPPSHFDF
jgi:hypothetical protein